jgi:hypothetical protein
VSTDLILRGRARPVAVAATAILVAGSATAAIATAMLVESPASVLAPLAFAVFAAWLAFLAIDNWFGWLSIMRDDGDWVITRGSPVRRAVVLRIPAARITLVERRLEERAPIYALVMGPRRENGLMSYGPIARVHLDPPPVGSKHAEGYVDLGKWLDLTDDQLDRLRDLLARPS